jgi:hypothetical protein
MIYTIQIAHLMRKGGWIGGMVGNEKKQRDEWKREKYLKMNREYKYGRWEGGFVGIITPQAKFEDLGNKITDALIIK